MPLRRLPPARACAATAAALVLLLLPPACPPAHAGGTACPDNMIWSGCHDVVGATSTEPGWSYEGAPWRAWAPCPNACYDARQGVLMAHAAGNPFSEGCIMGTELADEFVLSGGPAGTPIDFFAELTVEGRLAGAGSVTAFVRETLPAGAEDSRTQTATDPAVHFTLRVPLRHAAGDPFRVGAGLHAFGGNPDGVVTAWATLQFRGLASGWTLSSCQGTEVPVPAPPASWGRLKAVYR